MAHEKIKRGLLLLLGSLLAITGCGSKKQKESPSTSLETTEYVMESLQSLDLEAFNQYTDNCTGTHRSFLGIPTRSEYQVFQELLQPVLMKGKHDKGNYAFAQRLMEDLSWEIKEVRGQDEEAEIVLEISNLNMGKVMEEYTVYLLETMVDSEGLGLGELMQEIKDLGNDKEKLLALMDAQGEEDRFTREVTVRLSQKEDRWRLHLSEDFINAIMGNDSVENFSEDMERRMEELESQYERKIEEKLTDFGEQVEDWAERYFE
ncbi:MAG: hypothetical protein HFI33_05895 [Lachnospiraceae bacterium]|nr:hypothetical protein [Lachnospiraceae bacterium]